jgi:transcriptional regulator with XRE-family HTH domain
MTDENIDIIIGNRIRARRHVLGINQTDLGKKLGVTFQQVQKYEKGSNKIVASKLFKLSSEMDVPMSYFFEDLAQTYNSESKGLKMQEDPSEFVYDTNDAPSREAITLIKLYNNIKNKDLRKKLLSFLKALSQEQ